MIIKGLLDEDIVNYKLCSMFILFPYCTFKCEKECGIKCCQNSPLAKAEVLDVDAETIVQRYINNPISKAIVFGGLEPFDSWDDMYRLIGQFRIYTDDPIIIYTGYKEEEITEKINLLKTLSNIIIKFGRFIPNDSPIYDEVLGITLASHNQYAKKIS